ncbi:MAG: hypothetical protein KAT57_08610 [Candidatus Lokiarchaeota archaeon]|nr:hypothetical protein [Candidatus Lokiarchaeota archaeon]
MSFESKDKKYENVIDQDVLEKKEIDLKNAVVNHSKFHNAEEFIYFGTELVPFRDMHPLYKRIMLNEFAEAIKEFED